MSLEQSLPYLIFSLVAAVTPGPSNVILTATGSAVGFWRGLPCAAGVALGMGLLMFAVALGLGQAVLLYPLLLTALKLLGAAFLLWMAWKIATSGAAREGARQDPVGFLPAALFQWINPKSWLVSLSATGTYLGSTAAESTLGRAVIFALLFMAAAAPSGLIWLGFGASMQRLLRSPRSAAIFNAAMALALALSVAMVLW